MNIKDLYTLYAANFLVDTDTRNIRKNTLFFALKGENFNGNKFAEEALKKGASYSIVDEEQYVTNSKIILVNNVLETLQNLANYHRKKLGIPIISLTGSNGKTTTKELINAVLSQQYTTTATVGNLNNHIGVPLTLLSMTPKTEIGIVEMGANHHNEIAFLSKITEPNYGYITNFGKAHLEGFGSVEGVIEAKSELYEFLQQHHKTIFVNPFDEIQLQKTAKANRVFFDKSITFVEVNPFVKLLYNEQEIQSNLIGKYNFNNIAAAISIGKYFNVSTKNIKKAIENYTPTNNRSQVIKTQQNHIILDAYNANPTSMKAALENFSLLKAAQKTVILGDMFELGASSLEEHQQIANIATNFHFKNIYLVGKNFYNTTTNAIKFLTFKELKEHIQQTNITQNYILIKGSRGMALERILKVVN